MNAARGWHDARDSVHPGEDGAGWASDEARNDAASASEEADIVPAELVEEPGVVDVSEAELSTPVEVAHQPGVEPPAAAYAEVPRPTAPAPEPWAPAPEAAAQEPHPGFAPMPTTYLADLSAAAEWVQEPSAGPFQLGPSGLAVTVAGEMLTRMAGLVAVVGSVTADPEPRRRRGRATQDPFGIGPLQLHRVKGAGVLYLEVGGSHFHSIDLTDQATFGGDDLGAYLREELVFAFEEPVAFESGRLSGEGGVAMDMVHLKGSGRVLLQLDGVLRAMPVPPGAAMVVPLHRLVGWFGRVTPRLTGFGGQYAAELTGDGHALLVTP